MADEAEAGKASEDLHRLLAAFGQASLGEVMNSPAVSAEDRSHILREVAGHLGMAPKVVRMVEVLAEAGRISDLPTVARSYDEQRAERFRFRRAKVRSATALDGATGDQLRAQLERITGGRVELEVEIDPTLVAGWQARVGNLLIEADLRARLRRVREALVKG